MPHTQCKLESDIQEILHKHSRTSKQTKELKKESSENPAFSHSTTFPACSWEHCTQPAVTPEPQSEAVMLPPQRALHRRLTGPGLPSQGINRPTSTLTVHPKTLGNHFKMSRLGFIPGEKEKLPKHKCRQGDRTNYYKVNEMQINTKNCKDLHQHHPINRCTLQIAKQWVPRSEALQRPGQGGGALLSTQLAI